MLSSFLKWVGIFCLFLTLVACPLDNEKPPKQVRPLDLPELPLSIIQIPLEVRSSKLKQIFYEQFPNPLIEGSTEEFKMQLSGKEKRKEEDKTFLNRMTDPLLEWVDKTFLVSGKLLYRVDLEKYDFWFEKDKFFADITLDLATELKIKNGVSVLGKDYKIDDALECPIEARLVLEGKIEFTEEATIKILLDENNAKIKFQKICSSQAIKGIDIPKLLQPILEPVKKRIVKSVNQILAKQLQRLLSDNSEHLTFRDKIDSAAHQLGQPYALMEEVWLLPNVQEIFVSPIHGVGKGEDNRMEISIGAKAKPTVLISKTKPNTGLPKKASFVMENYRSKTNLYVHGKIPLDYAAEQVQMMLKEYVDQNYAQHGYTIGKTTIYAGEKKAVLAIEVLKAKNLKRKATIYLWGVPKYDAVKQEVYLDELAFTAKTKDVLLKFAQWIMNPKIMKQLELSARFGISEKLKEIQDQLNSFKVEEEMGTLTGKFDYVNLSEVFISETDFEIYMQAEGNLSLQLK